MNKTTMIFGVLGVVILLAAGYFFMQRDSQIIENSPVQDQTTNDQQNQTNNNQQEVSFEYKAINTEPPKVVRVEEGRQVKLSITSDVADEIHFHGYDISRDIEIGQPIIIDFSATKTGRFEIELHNSEKLVGIIEVYPK